MCQQYVKLGMVLCNPVKFHQNLTSGNPQISIDKSQLHMDKRTWHEYSLK